MITVTKRIITLSCSQKHIRIIHPRIFFPLIMFSGHTPFEQPMPGLLQQIPLYMYIYWHGKVLWIMLQEAHFMAWTFLWHSTMLISDPIGQVILKKLGN